MKYIFLGFAVPDTVMEQILISDKNMPVQTHKFGWSFIECLKRKGSDVYVISAIPVTNFPHYPSIFCKGSMQEERGVKIKMLPFINLLGIKHVTRFFSCLTELCKCALLTNDRVLIVHGVHSPFLFASSIAKFLFGFKIVVILTDPPSVLSKFDGLLSRILKKIDFFAIKFLLRNFDGGVILSKPLGDDFLSNKPTILIEGIFSNSNLKFEPALVKKSGSTFSFTYAGTLSESYGVKELIQAFIDLDLPNVYLNILGRGDLSHYVESISKSYSCIRYHGFKSGQDLICVYYETNVFINARPLDSLFVKYSFPSKIIEYMSTGIPVLTTKLPSIPDDYIPHLYFIDSPQVHDIKKSIFRVLESSSEELFDKGLKAKEFICKNKSADKASQLISSFLKSIK